MFILGDDWLSAENIILDFGLMKLRYKQHYFPLIPDVHISSIVELSKPVVFPPRSAVLCEVKVKTEWVNECVPGYISIQHDFMQDDPNWFAYDCSVVMNEKGTCEILIMNDSDKWHTMKESTIIGEFKENADIYSIQINNIQEVSQKPVEIQAPDDKKTQVSALIDNNKDLFAATDLELTQTKTVVMKVDTGDHEPISLRPYRVPLNKREVISKAVDEMLEAQIIEPSQSPWSFPVVVVGKKDGSQRFCVDFRQLNKITRLNSYPLPVIDDILAILGKAKYFTSLDLKSGYWQVKMDDNSKEKTAFACHKGLFHFNVMPFGLCNAPSVFMLLMNTVLKGLDSFAIAYLDDVIIFSENAEDHQKHIQAVFDRLREHNLKLKLKKCNFFAQEIEYLGFKVGQNGILPNPDKVAAIQTLPAPTCVREVRAFIGMCSYYRRFIPNFSAIAEPLISLTRKFARFTWSTACQTAFDFIKENLIKAPLLTYPNPNKPYTLYTDASDKCIGACLAQHDDSGEEKPIFFLSHKLSSTQTRWPTIEKEAYAINFSLQKLDPYLNGAKFTIKTDHRPLRHLLESPMKNRKVATWALNISSYNCTIEYIPGPQNVLADLLSRMPEGPDIQVSDDSIVENEISDRTFEINVLNSKHFDPKSYASAQPPDKLPTPDIKLISPEINLKEEQERDPALLDLRTKLKEGKVSDNKFSFFDDVLYFISHDIDPIIRLYVPQQFRERVLKQYHDENGHMGVDKTYLTCGVKYYWPNMFKQILEYVRACTTCQQRILKAKAPPITETDPPPYPFARVSMDISGPYPRSYSGNRYILSIVDHYSGYPEAYPLPTKSAERIADIFVDELFPRHACPLAVITDNGTENENEVMRKVFTTLNITHITTSFYHPQANAKVERFHRTLHDILAKKLDNDLTSWDVYLNQALAAVRFSVHESTGYSPFYLLYLRDPVLPLDNILKPRRRYMGEDHHEIALQQQHLAFSVAQRNMKKEKERYTKNANKNRELVELKPGDPVFLKNHLRRTKLESKWTPYFRVVEKLSPLTYLIRNQLSGKTAKSHIQHLRLASLDDWEIEKDEHGRPVRRAAYVVPPESESDEEENVERDDRIPDRYRMERSSSDSEDDIPLQELRRRIRERKERMEKE